MEMRLPLASIPLSLIVTLCVVCRVWEAVKEHVRSRGTTERQDRKQFVISEPFNIQMPDCSLCLFRVMRLVMSFNCQKKGALWQIATTRDGRSKSCVVTKA